MPSALGSSTSPNPLVGEGDGNGTMRLLEMSRMEVNRERIGGDSSLSIQPSPQAPGRRSQSSSSNSTGSEDDEENVPLVDKGPLTLPTMDSPRSVMEGVQRVQVIERLVRADERPVDPGPAIVAVPSKVAIPELPLLPPPPPPPPPAADATSPKKTVALRKPVTWDFLGSLVTEAKGSDAERIAKEEQARRAAAEGRKVVKQAGRPIHELDPLAKYL